MLDLKLLVTLREIARRGSFAAAAESLSFTASAVSQQMATLERQAGATLLERGPRGAVPTQAGEALLEHADAVIGRLADAQAEVDAIAGRRGGLLRFGSFPTATATFVAAAVGLFHSRYPEVDLRFADGEPYESLARMRARELDLAVTFALHGWSPGVRYDGVVVSSSEKIEYVELFEDPFLLVLPPGHELAGAETIPIERIEGERILGGSPWGPDLRRLCNLAGFEPRFDPAYNTADFLAFQALVAAGLGLTLIPRLAVTSLRDDIVVRPLDPPPLRHVRVALRAGSYRSPATEAMLDVLQEVALDPSATKAEPMAHPEPFLSA